MEDVTSILAAPREWARRYENLEAQLEVRDSTIATLEKALAAVTAERDAARAEVARLTAALNDIMAEFDNAGRGRDNGMMLIARAVLRGDTAPAGRE